MTARIIPLDSEDHREAQALLPWLANGTLAPAELERVRRHMAQCERCRSDAAWQEALRSAAVTLPTAGADVEQGWAAMRTKLAPREARRWPRFGWPALAGAQAIAMLALAAVLVTRTAPNEGEFRTLGNTPAAPTANALVVFRPGASEAQVREALRGAQARIVDGPTSTDAYLLYLPSLTPAGFARLRSNGAVMRVESLQGGKP